MGAAGRTTVENQPCPCVGLTLPNLSPSHGRNARATSHSARVPTPVLCLVHVCQISDGSNSKDGDSAEIR